MKAFVQNKLVNILSQTLCSEYQEATKEKFHDKCFKNERTDKAIATGTYFLLQPCKDVKI